MAFRQGFKPWIIWAAAAIFYLYEMILRVSPTVMTHQLMGAFSVTATSLGILSSFYYYSYNVLQIPCGIIVDRIGPRTIITASSALCAVGAYMFYSAQTLEMAELSRFIMGAGSACAFVGTLKLTAAWFPSVHFALLTGFTVMLGKLGGASQCAMAPLVDTYGWRTLMYGLSILGVFVTFFCWLLIRNSPKNTAIKPQKETFNIKALVEVLTNKQVIYVGLVGGFMYIPITGFGELWSTPFLMCMCDLDTVSSSQITALLYFGFAAGGPLFSWLTNVMKSHVNLMRLSCALSLVIFSAICYSAHLIPLNVVRILYFLGGLTAGGQVLCFTIAKENLPIQLSGTTVGFTNTLVMISALVFQPLIGKVLDSFWQGNLTQEGIRIYPKFAYQAASLSIPLGMLLCLGLLYMVKETFKKDQ
ncbi:MAG: hypothetical protein CNLJKLNK_00038 [Holosporales bacterium]